MKIGLIDVDGHNYPNLALMKISAYYKHKSDNINWYSIFDQYDIVYKAKVFTFTPDYNITINNADKIIIGGTGYNSDNKIPEENIQPDYDLYKNASWYNNNTAYGFLTRGCPNKCSWCIVPKKEGDIKPYMDIKDVAQDYKNVVLMDNNILSCDYGLDQIKKIIDLGIKVDFNQGLDVRLIASNKEIPKLLSKVNWIRYIRIACDTKSQIPFIEKALKELNSYGIKNYRVFVYVLVKDIKDAHERVLFLKEKGCNPFAQPYRDFENNTHPTVEQKRFARWVNHRAIFNTVIWEDYKN